MSTSYGARRREGVGTARQIDRALRGFARRRGIRVYCQAKNPPHLWDGRAIRLDRRPLSRAWLEDLAHELGHYLVTPEHRRHLPEYGTGTPYQVTAKYAEQIEKPHPYEEEWASLTGIALYRWAGAAPADVGLYAIDHQWDTATQAETPLASAQKVWEQRCAKFGLPEELASYRDGAWLADVHAQMEVLP